MRDDRIVDFSESASDFGISVRDIFGVIRKRIAVILLLFIVVFSWKAIDTYSITPIYTASSDVLIEQNQSAGNFDRPYYSRWDPQFLTTQTEIIRSENVAKRVVENLQLEKKYKRYFLYTGTVKPSFTSKITGEIKKFARSLIPDWGKKKIKSGRNTENPAVGFPTETYNESDVIAGMIRGGLGVVPLPDTKIVTISYRHKNPAIAKLVSNAVVQAYKDVTLEIKHSSNNYTLQWMTEKANEERKKLEEAENSLQKYKRENDLVTVEDRLAVIPQKLSQINSEFTKAQTERKELEDIYEQIKNAKSNISELESIPLFANNSVIQSIREKLFRARQNIKELSKKYGYKHPKMIKAKDELDILRNELSFEVKRIVASTKNSYELALSRENNLKELLAKTKAELLMVNEKFVQLSIMQREVDTNRVLYDALTSSIKKTGVTEQAQSVNIWVVRKAENPGWPSYPNTRKALIVGALLGLGIGFAAAFTLEYLDNTIKSEKDLLAKFELTLLGSIEQLKGSKEEVESHILRQPLSPLAESYRLVRSNLLLSSPEHPPKTILVTSMSPKEGKTSTSINIARVLSQDDRSVLVIDCDLRKPRMHSLFGIENKMGLSNYLTGNIEGNLIVDIPGEDVKLIPSGLIPPNPAELLNSKKMKELVEKMSGMFDFVILDSPPIQRVTDSLTLSQLVDGTIVVVRAGSTTYDMLYSGMKKLQNINANFLGFVLNGLRKAEAGSGYYAGYNTYYAKDE